MLDSLAAKLKTEASSKVGIVYAIFTVGEPASLQCLSVSSFVEWREGVRECAINQSTLEGWRKRRKEKESEEGEHGGCWEAESIALFLAKLWKSQHLMLTGEIHVFFPMSSHFIPW